VSAEPQRVADLLGSAARELVETVDGSGCAISRAIGDVLVLVAEHTGDGRTLQLGQGFLISDYPATRAVLEQRAPKTLSLDDPDVDPAEAALLREYGYDALLMLPIEQHGRVWGLIEVYRRASSPFADADVAAAQAIAVRTGEALQRL
jgi:GAF domain-containing protein